MAKFKDPSAVVRAWRASKGLSMRTAAPVIGVSVQTILLLERGELPRTVRIRERFERVCGVRDWRQQ